MLLLIVVGGVSRWTHECFIILYTYFISLECLSRARAALSVIDIIIQDFGSSCVVGCLSVKIVDTIMTG